MSNMRSDNESVAQKTPKNSKVSSYFKSLKEEITLITWPKRDQVIKSAITVIMVTAIVGCIVFVADQIFTYGLTNYILNQ